MFWKSKTHRKSSQVPIAATDSPATPPVDRLLGLRVLHEPVTEETPTSPSTTKVLELVFVHGLGGSAKDTWTHANSGFWPSWLHEDGKFHNVRISAFGYDADYKNVFAARNALGITDFANQLLDSLDLHFHKYGDVASFT